MTDEDRLLKELAERARARAAREPDPRWDALAAGTLPPEEVARLQEEARTSPEAAAAWELFRPLGVEFQARVVSRVRPRRSAWRRALPPLLAAAAALAVALGLWRRPA